MNRGEHMERDIVNLLCRTAVWSYWLLMAGGVLVVLFPN
jgi:hypothetical protein